MNPSEEYQTRRQLRLEAVERCKRLDGIVANLRLVQLLRRLSANTASAHRVLFAWLAGNFFFGSQLTWILRPFIGSPGLPVEFLRKEAFHGNFYETVFRSLAYLIHDK